MGYREDIILAFLWRFRKITASIRICCCCLKNAHLVHVRSLGEGFVVKTLTVVIVVMVFRLSSGDADNHGNKGHDGHYDGAQDNELDLSAGSLDVEYEVAGDLSVLVTTVIDKAEVFHCSLSLSELILLAEDQADGDCEEDELDEEAEAGADRFFNLSAVAAFAAADEEEHKNDRAADEASTVADGGHDDDSVLVEGLLFLLEGGCSHNAVAGVLFVAFELPRDGRARPEQVIDVLLGRRGHVHAVVGKAFKVIEDSALVLDVVFGDLEAHVDVSGVVLFVELLHGATVLHLTIHLKRIECRSSCPRSVQAVKARLLLNLEGGKRQVVTLSLAGHEFVIIVDFLNSVGSTAVGGCSVGNSDELGKGDWAISSLGLAHADSVFKAGCCGAGHKVGLALVGCSTNLAGGLWAGSTKEGGASTRSTEAHVEELVLLHGGQNGDGHAGFALAGIPRRVVFVSSCSDVAIVFTLGHDHLVGAKAESVELVDEASLLGAFPLPHKHALSAVGALVVGDSNRNEGDGVPVPNNC